MLLQFNFKNFKSFRDDTTLDLTATKITECSHHVVSIGNEKVLPVAAIYGANASGKSNVVEAFRYMRYYVIDSFAYGGNENKKNSLESTVRYPLTPFLFDADSQSKESSFEVYFIDSEKNGAKTYNYGFTIDKEGVREEWLNCKSKSSKGDFTPIFYRKGLDLIFSSILKKSHENIEIALQKETLVVSLGEKLKVDNLNFIYNWFLFNDTASFGDPVENYVLLRQQPYGFVEHNSVQKKVVEYLSSFDPSIIGFEVEKDERSDEKDSARISTVHKIMNSDRTVAIPLSSESDGTQKMFAFYRLMQIVFRTGGALFVDELNSRLHPLLVRAVVLMFINPEINKNHAQLIFTTHDSWQLNNNLLRRDEVWFTEKSEDGISTLYSLADFVDEDGAKIRKDENYEKNYLLGKYGAIPTLKNFDMFKEE